MTLIRAAARTMLASYFIASGIKALRNPEPLVPLAEPIADKVVPFVKQYAPEQVAGFIPEDAKTLVRVNAAAQVLGGLALASGKGRRVGAWLLAGSLVPSTAAKHPFWSRTDPAEKALDRSQFIKNISLLGGVLLAAGDTEGKPSLAWRAQKGGQAIAKSTKKATKKIGPASHGISDTASDLAETASDFAGTALAGGATLVGAVVASSRKARKQAQKQLKVAGAVAAKQAVEARKAAEAAAKQAKKDAPKLAKAAKKLAIEQAEAAKKIAAERAEAARKAAAQAKKDAPKIAKANAAEAKKLRKNISLGEN
jgi:uncharacterized membrane protein YphA (DoxX/SURF4 family)